MKLFSILFAFAAFLQSASATTVLLAGGTEGYHFSYTNLSGTTALTSANSTIQVGSITANAFTQFAPNDPSAPAFGSGPMLSGLWLGDASDDSNAADAFNGAQIWFRVSTVVDGQTYTAYFSDTGVLFPSNDGGIDDLVMVDSSGLDTIAPISNGNWSIDTANQQIRLNTVPEPSAALLGGLGALVLLRRRRSVTR